QQTTENWHSQCLVGYPPFCSPSAHVTYRKIIDWRHELYFTYDVHLSRKSEDLIRGLFIILLLLLQKNNTLIDFLADHGLDRRSSCTPSKITIQDNIHMKIFWIITDFCSLLVTDTSYTDDLRDAPNEPVGADPDSS
ncbi:hypothetical protein PSHT_13591, partial [Puccinia striiformis]